MSWYDTHKDIYGADWRGAGEARLDALRRRAAAMRAERPEASAVVIARDEATRLLACLESLCANEPPFPVELLVVDNGSSDSTARLLDRVGVRRVFEPQAGPGHARTAGLRAARGRWHLCLDGDTMYPPHYMETMVKALRRPGTACAYALWSFLPDERHSAPGLALYEGLRDIYLRLQQLRRPELNARGMALAFPADAGRRHGFRTDLRRGEDGSLALALKAEGRLRLVTSRRARPVTGHGTTSRDGGLGGMFRARLLKALRAAPALLTARREYKDEPGNLL